MYSYSEPAGLSTETTPALSWCRLDKVHRSPAGMEDCESVCVCVFVCVCKHKKVQCRDAGDFEGRELIPN